MSRTFEASQIGKMTQAVGFARPPTIAFFGDSIGAFAATGGSSTTSTSFNLDGISPLFWALCETYWGDILLDGRTYANGGYVYAVGGTGSSDLLTTQIGQLVATAVKPDIAYVQSLQNDSLGTLSAAQTAAANVTSFATQALAAGVKLVIICPCPPRTSSFGAGIPKGKDETNRILETFCNVTPGCVFLNYMPLVTNPDGASENLGASAYVAWRGTDNTATGYATDGTHPSTLASRAVARVLSPIFQQLCRPLFPRVVIGQLYDATNHPYGNVIGKNGLFQGSGGQYNGSNNSNVAGVTQANGDRWIVSDSNGVVVTPMLTTDSDGFVAQRLTFSGTASAAATISLTHNFIFDVTSAQYTSEALLKFNNVNSMNEFAMTGGGARLGSGAASAAQVPDGFSAQMYLRSRKPVTFSNSGSANKTFNLTFTFASGVSPTGSVDISRCGIFRES